jgi:hypothetical protein
MAERQRRDARLTKSLVKPRRSGWEYKSVGPLGALARTRANSHCCREAADRGTD